MGSKWEVLSANFPPIVGRYFNIRSQLFLLRLKYIPLNSLYTNKQICIFCGVIFMQNLASVASNGKLRGFPYSEKS